MLFGRYGAVRCQTSTSIESVKDDGSRTGWMYSELGEWSAIRSSTVSAAYNTYKVSVKLLYTTEVF